jgi:hypothetical protein
VLFIGPPPFVATAGPRPASLVVALELRAVGPGSPFPSAQLSAATVSFGLRWILLSREKVPASILRTRVK